MKKQLTLIAVALLVASAAWAQKPKANFDFQVFAKKLSRSGPQYVTDYLPLYKDLQNIAKVTGQTIEELNKKNNADKDILREDANFSLKNGLNWTYDKAELAVVQETPIKKGDITLFCRSGTKTYTITFTNCVQTSYSWFLGERIVAKGDALGELIAANAAVVAAQNEKFAKQDAARAKNDSIRIANEEYQKSIKGYRAKLFPQQGTLITDEYTAYVHTDMYNKSVPGYVIGVNGNKVNVDNIRYWEPYTLLMMGPTLGDLMAAPPIPAKDVAAFWAGDQMFVQHQPQKWSILIGEGAIRQLVTFNKVKVGANEVYTVNHLLQKFDANPENHSSISLSFKDKMSEYVKENTELANKIKRGDINYQAGDLARIVTDYNIWYEKQFPGKVKYLPLN